MNSINQIIHWLEEKKADTSFDFTLDYDLGRSSTMRLKASGHFLKVYNIDFLVELFKKFSGQHFLFLGKGANSILSENRNDKIYLRLQLDRLETETQLSQTPNTGDSYWLPASTSLSQLVVYAKTHGLDNWEGLTGIPGTLGGAIAMNAGTKLGEISKIVCGIRIIRSCGKLDEIAVTESDFSYRKNHFLQNGDLILYAKLNIFTKSPDLSKTIKKYLDYRTQTQPLWEKTCGSVFKNHSRYLAGKTIDLTCLKGLRSGGLMVSQKHANFIVNNFAGNQSDFVRLTNALNQEIELIYGVSFELEAQFL